VELKVLGVPALATVDDPMHQNRPKLSLMEILDSAALTDLEQRKEVGKKCTEVSHADEVPQREGSQQEWEHGVGTQL